MYDILVIKHFTRQQSVVVGLTEKGILWLEENTHCECGSLVITLEVTDDFVKELEEKDLAVEVK